MGMEARCWPTGRDDIRRPGLRVPDGGIETRAGEAADWPRTGPNFDIRSHNSGHNRRRDFAATVLPWGKTWRAGNGVASWTT